MIEFDGYLTGKAEKHYRKRELSVMFMLTVISFAMVFPIIIPISFKFETFSVVGMYFLIMCLSLIIIMTKTKKGWKKITPKRIYVQDETITCVSDMSTQHKYIEDVKLVRDFGEYYDLVFPMGKKTQSFVCQKNLLTQGTLEEFEALFEGKIVCK